MMLGPMNHYSPNQPECVDHNMSLSALNPFVGIKASKSPNSCCFDRLRIDYCSTGTRLTTNFKAISLSQSIVHQCNKSLFFPASEVIIDTRPGCKIMRQHAPLAPCFQKIKDAIKNLATKVIFTFALVVEQVFDSFPLGVRQVGGISHGFGESGELELNQITTDSLYL